MKKITKTGILIINICIIIFLPCVFFTLLTSRSDVLANIRSFDVITGSMKPAINVGTIIYTFPEKSYARGEIIAFQRDTRTITHRIVNIKQQKNETIYFTKGDANTTADAGGVHKNSVIGKVIFQVPYIGNFMDFLKTIPGFVIFIVIPSVFIIVTEFNNIKKEIEKEFEKKLAVKNAHEL